MALRVTGEGRSLLSALGHDWGGPSAHAAPPTPAATADVTRMAEGMSAIDRVKQSFGLLTRKTSESSAVQKILVGAIGCAHRPLAHATEPYSRTEAMAMLSSPTGAQARAVG